MRTLAVILAMTLAVGVGMGQTFDTNVSEWRPKPGGYVANVVISADTLSASSHREHSVIVRLTQLWREYKDSCYADSTTRLTHHANALGQMCLYDWDCIIIKHYWNETTHFHPTFEGFMDFVTRRTR